jgi:hypothetical protein
MDDLLCHETPEGFTKLIHLLFTISICLNESWDEHSDNGQIHTGGSLIRCLRNCEGSHTDLKSRFPG